MDRQIYIVAGDFRRRRCERISDDKISGGIDRHRTGGDLAAIEDRDVLTGLDGYALCSGFRAGIHDCALGERDITARAIGDQRYVAGACIDRSCDRQCAG